MTGTTLLTGGTGKTSSRLAKKLQCRNISVLLTSRRGQAGVPTGFKGVAFDWYDETTYTTPFNEDKNIDTIYIILPDPTPGRDSVALVKQFIDLAKKKGVKRFLLMSGSPTEKGGQEAPHGQIHAYLDTIGVDYAVLRPSWFFTNFLVQMPSIKATDEIITASGEGKVGFVAEDDIADVALELLTAPKLGGIERIIVGPELLSHDEVAEQLSQVLGRKISHRRVSADECKANYIKVGLPEQLAGMLSYLEVNHVAAGGEEKIFNAPSKATGKIRFREFAEDNKAAWQK